MPYIETIAYEDSSGELRQIYDSLIKARGKLAAVHQIQSLNPAALLAHMDLYKAVMFARSPLKRYQREMLAVIVSAANQCPYCIAHHTEALLFYWKDADRAARLLSDRENAGLDAADLALCQYAEDLSLRPGESANRDIENLRAQGLDDRAILDTAQIIAYFNFVNRLVLGLGLAPREEEVKGYNYGTGDDE